MRLRAPEFSGWEDSARPFPRANEITERHGPMTELSGDRTADMGSSQSVRLSYLSRDLLGCDGALRNRGLAPDAANPSFAWVRNNLNVRVTGILEEIAMLLNTEERHTRFLRVSLRSF